MINQLFTCTFLSLILLIYVSSNAYSLEITTEIIGSKYLNSLGYLGQDKSICIIDTGVDYTHQNLGDCSQFQFLSGTCQKVPTGFDFGDNDSNPFPNRNHGTYVAGVTSSDNSLHTGVSPLSKVIPIKITNDAMTLSDISK